MTILNNKKFISFFFLCFSFLSNSSIANSFLTEKEILRKSNECFKDFQSKECLNLILKMEKIQLVESEQNRYKCQSSILGLQTELVQAFYFKKLTKNKKGIMSPYVIKNCKFLRKF